MHYLGTLKWILAVFCSVCGSACWGQTYTLQLQYEKCSNNSNNSATYSGIYATSGPGSFCGAKTYSLTMAGLPGNPAQCVSHGACLAGGEPAVLGPQTTNHNGDCVRAQKWATSSVTVDSSCNLVGGWATGQTVFCDGSCLHTSYNQSDKNKSRVLLVDSLGSYAPQ
jgi:hypothetical protein